MKNLIAVNQIQIAPSGGFKGLGTGTLSKPGNGVDAFVTFISGLIAIMTVIAIIWFIFIFITGAIGIISSGGDKQALEAAKKKITSAIIGLVVVLLAIVIINIVGSLLGISNILNISQLLCKPLGTCP
jgi:hypothetical protein